MLTMTAARGRRCSLVVALGLVVLLLLGGCAAGPAEVSDAAGAAGFFTGLWHGLILPVTFVVSLFNDTVGVYDVHNCGHLYDFGFVFGAGGLALPGFLSHRSGRARGAA
jgi:hypothetical protein